jgi:Molybdopterin-binding domain of aldehyde dehydrogenase
MAIHLGVAPCHHTVVCWVQVEGGFVQGMGWTCIEELVWGDSEHTWVRPGTLHTRGPGPCCYLLCNVRAGIPCTGHADTRYSACCMAAYKLSRLALHDIDPCQGW